MRRIDELHLDYPFAGSRMLQWLLKAEGFVMGLLHVAMLMKKAKIAISMDGKGAQRDNVFVERLWRAVKYKEVCLHAYKTVSEARVGVGRYLNFYNPRRCNRLTGGRRIRLASSR
jgi:putative transposase